MPETVLFTSTISTRIKTLLYFHQTFIFLHKTKSHYKTVMALTIGIYKLYIPVRIASTGSNLEAEIAGKIPEIKPIKTDKPEPNNILNALSTNSKSKALVKIMAIIQTKTIPNNPPNMAKITASNKN